MMKHRILMGVLAILSATAPAWGLKVGDAAPELRFSDWVKGKEVSLGEQTEGKVVIVEWWATWCGPCYITIPHLTELQHEHPDDVIVIGATAKDPRNKKKDVKKFVKEWDDRMMYTIAFDSSGRVEKDYMRAYGANSIPTAFVIDQQGKLAWVGHPMAGMNKVVKQLLAGEFDAETHARSDEIVRNLEAAIRKRQKNRIEKMIPDALEYVGSPDDLGRLAFLMLHEQSIKKSLAEEALSMVERANYLADGENWRVLDTYALALFENDRVGKAVRTQKKAIMNCEDDRSRMQLESSLKKYQKARKKLASRK